MSIHIHLNHELISDFCRRWLVSELAVFGSVLRDDFRPDSDVDILVDFFPEAPWSLLDLVRMQDELAGMFNRDVDIVEKRSLRNPFRRREILEHHEVLYAA